MNIKKNLLFSCFIFLLCFSSCVSETKITNNVKSLNLIFNTNSVGFTKINIRRSEWNKMLQYFDYFYKNENSVRAESYEYEKDGKTWKLENVGLRLRGNTSRFRPQGKDTASDKTGHTQMNADWSKDYYNYAAECSDDDYRQSHFKVDFDPDDNGIKLADCMKGVALKRSDSYFSKEIFCYYLFQQYGIWTAPRASQTKVYINIIEDVKSDNTVIEDISECAITNIDYGVYEMFEEVNKQSLKARMRKNGNNRAKTAWVNNDGDLWKCSGGNLTADSNKDGNFGCEKIKILNTEKDESEWSFVWYNPCYDLKTNKKSVESAKLYFQSFISELNYLSSIDSSTPEGIAARKAFYEKWFDVDFFMTTYAVNMLVGMDDDYWGNANNYYLYFDNGAGGSGKCYLIPFDYDNTLGSSITGDKVLTDPMKWGNGNDRPLLDRLLEVPEYNAKFKNELLRVSSQSKDSPWNKDKCFALWNKWFNQVSPYVYTADIKGWPNISSLNLDDSGGWKEKRHYLTSDYQNIYEETYKNFKYWLSDSNNMIVFDLNGGSINGNNDVVIREYTGTTLSLEKMIENPVRSGYEFLGWTKTKNGFDYTNAYDREDGLVLYASWLDYSEFAGEDLTIKELKDSTYEGIKIYMANLPENHYRRAFYINGVKVGEDSLQYPEKYNNYTNMWAYPFLEKGKTYEIYVVFSDKGSTYKKESNHLVIKAESGKGAFKVVNKPEYYIQNNILKWKAEPIVQIGDGVYPTKNDNWSDYFVIQVMTNNPWSYLSWNWVGASCNKGFNFTEHVNENVLNGEIKDVYFEIQYNYNRSPYGDYFIKVLTSDNFNLDLD